MKVVNCRVTPTYTKYIGRGSALGNPFTHLPLERTKALVQTPDVATSVSHFELWARGDTRWDKVIQPTMRHWLLEQIKLLKSDDVLGCFCNPGSPCHGQVIIKLWYELAQPAAAPKPRQRKPKPGGL